MSLRYLIFIFSIFFFTSAFSQKKELHIVYDFFFKDYYPEERQINVLVNNKESLDSVIRTINYKRFGETEFKPTSFYTIFYKTNDSVFYKEVLGKEDFYISEPLNQIKWKLTGNYKKILGYNCQEATTHFRGRDYAAYFTTKIPFKAAPLKFYGLPGVVLAVQTTDGRIKIQALELQIKPSTGVIKNPFFVVNNFITRDAFEKIYKKYTEDLKNKVMGQFSISGTNNGDVNNPRVIDELRMEIIVSGNGGY